GILNLDAGADPASATSPRVARVFGRSTARVCQKESMSSDVQNVGGVGLFEAIHGSLLSSKDLGIGEQRLSSTTFLARSAEWRKVDLGEASGGGDAAANVSRGPRSEVGVLGLCYPGSCRLAEIRVRNHQRPTLAIPRHLHAQQVAPAGEIADGIPLHCVTAVLVYQRFKWDEVELSIG